MDNEYQAAANLHKIYPKTDEETEEHINILLVQHAMMGYDHAVDVHQKYHSQMNGKSFA